jgi:hypothetical protein
MVYLFKTLYTYQTIAKEVLKETIFEERIKFLKAKDMHGYAETLEGRAKGFQ